MEDNNIKYNICSFMTPQQIETVGNDIEKDKIPTICAELNIPKNDSENISTGKSLIEYLKFNNKWTNKSVFLQNKVEGKSIDKEFKYPIINILNSLNSNDCTKPSNQMKKINEQLKKSFI